MRVRAYEYIIYYLQGRRCALGAHLVRQRDGGAVEARDAAYAELADRVHHAGHDFAAVGRVERLVARLQLERRLPLAVEVQPVEDDHLGQQFCRHTTTHYAT